MEKNHSRPRRVGPRPGHRHRPLSLARASVLNRLQGQPEPVTIASLVSLTRLHENTVREHLNALVHRGLVRRHRAEPEGRGRPVWLYSETGGDPASSEYPGMVAAVADDLATASTDPVHDGTAAGQQWGRTLVRDRGWEHTSPAQARERVVELFDDLGFEPVPDENAADSVLLTRCPLLEAAYRDTDVVRAVHVGIVRGALIELGADPAESALVPFAEPGACLLRIPPVSLPNP